MSRLLAQAFEAAATLPEEDQNRLAGWLLAEVENSRRAATGPSWADQLLDQLPSSVDPTQIAERLKLTPTERLLRMQEVLNGLEEAKRSRGQ